MATGTQVRHWPGMRSEHAVLPPHEGTTVTGADQIGISFSAHQDVRFTLDGRAGSTTIRPGSAVVSGRREITWVDVREPTEALEIYPDPALVAATVAELTAHPVEDTAVRIGVPDGVVLAAGSVLRRVHLGAAGLTDVAASTIAHRLALHLVERYRGVPVRRHRPGRLDPRTVDRVVQRIEAGLDGVLTLDALAEVARLSPFHFARAFKATTGLTPHELVTARRMDRAATLLTTTALPVAEIAGRVGFSNVGHFRRLFARHHAIGPSALRTPQDPTL